MRSPNKIPSKRPPPADLQRHMVPATGSTPPKKAAHIASGARREPCAKCGLPVFIAERLNVGKTLYHRTCFRCADCDAQLNLDNTYDSEDGQYRCKVCPDKETDVISRSLSDEEKSANLKGDADPYSANFENVLEEPNDDSLKRSFTLDRMLGGAFQKARSDFMTTQMAAFDSDLETEPEDEPPDLPVSPKPLLGHSENTVEFSNNSLPSLSDNSSVDSDRSDQKLCESQDPVTKDSISTRDVSIKPSIRSRVELFEAGIAKCAKSDVNRESREKSVEFNPIAESPRKSCQDVEQSSGDVVADVSENSVDFGTNNSQPHSGCFSVSSRLSDSNEVIVISSETSAEHSVVIISDASEDSSCQPTAPPCEKPDNIDEDVEKPTPVIEYPEDLNPFGEEEEEDDDDPFSTPSEHVPETVKPASLNPFGDSDEEAEEELVENSKSLNPFGSDDEEENLAPLPPQPKLRKLKAPKISLTPYWEEEDSPKGQENEEKNEDQSMSPRPTLRKIKAPKISLTPFWDDESACQTSEAISSSTSRAEKSSLHGSGRKKKPAPKPPCPLIPKELDASPCNSSNSSPSHKVSRLSKEPPRSRKTRRAPPPPTSTPSRSSEFSRFPAISPIREDIKPSQYETGGEEKMKAAKDETNRIRQHAAGPSNSTKKLTLKEIEHDLELVEVQMRGLEKNGVILEKIIREKSEIPGANPDDTLAPEVEDMILELFELVNEKCELFRKQTELNYLRRQNRLEKEQAEIENQLRCLMLQPDAHKTDSDKAKEEELLNKMLEIVERRNEIVDRLEYDRRREKEEDMSIRSHMSLYSMKRESGHSSSKKSNKRDKQKGDKNKKSKKSKGDVDKDIDESTLSSKDKKKKKVLNLF
ncbi:MICAL-like protein 1 isoform X2 [Coccinella septempunctata]|uniref:MICAL-like protein 1 isoform X2 n=1 Tax=Coccinella septempunctata TaxID=41139 RepID=UPI001D08ABDC|nr:MICAL-like protein 1 isoform X2 [Coccinella septempunctata]